MRPATPTPCPSRAVPRPDGVRTLIVGPGEPIPAPARGCPRLVRRYATPAIDPPPDLPAREALRLDLVHSRAVSELARETVAEIARLDARRFVALHVRRGDRLWQYPRSLTEPGHLGDVLPGARSGRIGGLRDVGTSGTRPSGSPLKRHFRLVRYPDFPRLAALVSDTGDRRPDNYLLYEVENAIASRARMLFSTFPRGLVPGRARPRAGSRGPCVGRRGNSGAEPVAPQAGRGEPPARSRRSRHRAASVRGAGAGCGGVRPPAALPARRIVDPRVEGRHRKPGRRLREHHRWSHPPGRVGRGIGHHHVHVPSVRGGGPPASTPRTPPAPAAWWARPSSVASGDTAAGS